MGVLAVCDRNQEYINAFMEYVDTRQGLPFKVAAFTGKESLKEYTAVRHVDILLISSEMMEDGLELDNVGKTVLLISGNVELKYKDYTRVYKYQPVENIIRHLLDCYGQMNKEEALITPGVEANVIGVYSPLGRTGQTTFSLVMGQILAEKARSLYINMEEFSAFDKIFDKNYSGDLSDLMYSLKQNPENMPVKLQTVINSLNGLDYIPPLAYSADLRNIAAKEWIKLINVIKVSGNYHNIILDLGSIVSDVFQILDTCNTVYMPITDDRISLMKVTAYEEYMLRSGRENLMNRTIKVKIPKMDVRNWDKDYMEQQLSGSVGDFIRKMLREAA